MLRRISAIVILCCVPALTQSITHLNPDGLRNNRRFTQVIGVNAGQLWVVSGQAATDSSGEIVARDFREQATQVFQNLQRALTAAGLDFSNVIKLNSYLVDLPHNLETYRQVREQFMARSKGPASTTVGVVSLTTKGALLEVEAMAVGPQTPSSSTTRIMVTSILRAQPEMAWELKEQLQNRVAISRKQPGCLNYDLYISQDDPSLFMLHENWTDQASLDQHFQTIEHDSWTKIRNKYVAERHVYFWRMAESKSSQ